MKYLLFICCMALSLGGYTQNNSEPLPYSQIPDYPETYSAETVAARMIDGLGFRYYWATEGLREQDLAYKPSAEGRTSKETLEHLYNLCEVIYNTAHQKPTERGNKKDSMSFEEQRKQTLLLIKAAADKLREAAPGTLEKSTVAFKRGDRVSEFPFWNLINGPIADALWHTGQIVLLRRASGNPFNSKVSVFNGRLRE